MNAPRQVGFFGKLPAHGDFIYRDLPSSFVNLWDSWLQGFIGSSQEQLGDQWLDIYLTSPIWRFAFSDGVIDQFCWAGILLPSVDRVGRYFPFSIIRRFPAGSCMSELLSQDAWFELLEQDALKALDGQMNIDELLESINKHQPASIASYQHNTLIPNSWGSQAEVPFGSDSQGRPALQLLDALLKNSLSSYSLWSTQGSQQIDPCMFYCKNLPSMGGAAAMLDGNWRHWGWNQPFQI